MANKPNTDHISLIGAKLRPEQTITMEKLRELLPSEWSKYQLYADLAEMQRRGMITREVRKPTGKTKITFHNPPIDKPQPPTKRSRNASLVFDTKTSFVLTAGTYTAEELRSLARQVLKTLGEL